MKQIPLMPFRLGLVALVDDCDFEMLSRYKWEKQDSGSGKLYAITRKWNGMTRKYKRQRMHLMLVSTNNEIDHRNGNGLDNRRENLRPSTRSQNGANIGRKKATGFKGVYPVTDAKPMPALNPKRWCARIQKQHLGRFVDPRDAAMAYDVAAIERFGEFARTNQMLGLL